MEKTVYIVRHGQSEGNINPIYQPLDSPLSEEGKRQAVLIADRVSKISFEKLISSPLTRAKETAEAISKVTGHLPEYSDLFIERVKPTRLFGKSYDDEEAKNLNKLWEESLHTSGLRAEDGENFDDLISRADKALDFLKNRPEKDIVVVSHGFFARAVIARVLLDDSLTENNFKNLKGRTKIQNTGLSALKYEDSWEGQVWKLWVYNDQSHLG